MIRFSQYTKSVTISLIGFLLFFNMTALNNIAVAQELKETITAFSDSSLHPLSLTLPNAIEMAKHNYPEIKAAIAHEQAAQFGIRKAKTAYLPKGNLLIQEVRGTSNNITGPLLPQLTIPTIAGAVNGAGNDLSGAWVSGLGSIISWEPFDFGLRKSQVNLAKAITKETGAQRIVTELQVQSAAAEAFLNLVAAQQVLKAKYAQLDRLKIFTDTVKILVSKELKPGVDQYLAEAELARAQDEVTDAEQAKQIATVSLARLIGIASDSIIIDTNPLIESPPEIDIPTVDPFQNPLILSQKAAVDVAHAKLTIINKTYRPQFSLIGVLWGRGSGFRTDISVDESKGYLPTKFNYAVGLSVSFPILDIFPLRADKKIAIQNEAEQCARYELALLNIRTQDLQVHAMLQGALKVAANAPVRLKAATEAAKCARIRYEHALTTVNDIAQDEQLLTQAQVDYALAQLRVWRALLAGAVTMGDIRPFVNHLKNASLQRR